MKTLLNTIKARKLKMYAHTKYHNSVMQNILELEGKVEGRSKVACSTYDGFINFK